MKAAISQVGDPIWSMHKKKNKEAVLAGELILTFYKSGKFIKPKTKRHFDVAEMLNKTLLHNSSGKLYGEYLFNRLVIEAWNNSAIDSLKLSRTDFIDLIERQGWHYDTSRHYWTKEKSSEPSLFSSEQTTAKH